MFIVERIGKLILVTMEGILDDNAVDIMKLQIRKIAEDEDEAVVSINHSGLTAGDKISDISRAATEIVDYCKEKGIRVCSYYNK